MRWTRFFIPTLKEAPKDAVVPSHALMLRAGLIRQLAAGVYSYLPLGYRSLRKIEAIIREEMNRAGAIELHLPVLHPLELWEQSGRAPIYGDVLLRLAGPKDDWRSQTVLGPTHEEPVTEIARAFLNSYKQLPINFYQIQVKFRGEARPKSGVLRTREFLMKDAYSFDRDKAGLDLSYQKMYDAYCRIFSRCGLPYVICEAESGPIGGDASHEFMVRTDAGEDVIVRCAGCGYAANTERAVPRPLPQDESPMMELKEVHTPSQRTIDEVTAYLKLKPSQMIKTLIYEDAGGAPGGDSDAGGVLPATDSSRAATEASRAATDSGRGREGAGSAHARTGASPVSMGGTGIARVFVVLVRGDHEVNENKLNRVAAGVFAAARAAHSPPFQGGEGRGSSPQPKLQLAEPATIERLTGAPVGFAGPHTLGRSGMPYVLIVDQAVAVMRNAASGANKADYHVTGLNPGRDFPLPAVVQGRGFEVPSRDFADPSRDFADPSRDREGAVQSDSNGSSPPLPDRRGSACRAIIADVRTVAPGDRCEKCGGDLIFEKCIEIGHVFKLGTKYSDALKATFLDQDGKAKPFIMGCYGIGLNRIMAAAIEAHHDDAGIIWPMSIAPFEVLIVALDPRDEQVMSTAAKIHDDLEAAGIDVLLDDRDERAGFKFKDADLIGIPLRITVGKKSLAEGVVELKRRDAAAAEMIPPQDAVGWVADSRRSFAS